MLPADCPFFSPAVKIKEICLVTEVPNSLVLVFTTFPFSAAENKSPNFASPASVSLIPQ